MSDANQGDYYAYYDYLVPSGLSELDGSLGTLVVDNAKPTGWPEVLPKGLINFYLGYLGYESLFTPTYYPGIISNEKNAPIHQVGVPRLALMQQKTAEVLPTGLYQKYKIAEPFTVNNNDYKNKIKPTTIPPQKYYEPHVDVGNPIGDSLSEQFYELLSGVSLPDCAVAIKGKEIIGLDRFRLIPLSSEDGNTCYPMYGKGYAVGVEQGVRLTYTDRSDGAPYLDTLFAVGLVYDDHLIAVAGARVERSGVLNIIQIQDVTGTRKVTAQTDNPDEKREARKRNKQFYKTGLHNGLDWRKSLIRVWEEIANRLGITTMAVQSAENNRWPVLRDSPGSEHCYDVPAQELGYTLDRFTGNYVKDLHEQQTSEADTESDLPLAAN